jgi:hypothetical protein
MSEYQYYEFLALDSRLDAEQMAELRSISSRASITPTGFSNEYSYGSLKARPMELLAQYFDVYVYVAKWGTREVAFRLPRNVVGPDELAWLGSGDHVSVEESGDYVIVGLTSETEDYQGWVEGGGWIGSLAGVREALLHGDERALYVVWLHSLGDMDVDLDQEEPPVPAGLGNLSASLATLVEFLRIDEHLVAAAAERSGAQAAESEGMADWIARLDTDEKDRLLLRVAKGDHGQVAALLARGYRAAQHPVNSGSLNSGSAPRRRRVGELLDRAEALRDAWAKEQEVAAERERLERERVVAVERNRRLDALAKREAAAWQDVEDLVDSKVARAYDDAIQLLLDLCALAIRSSKEHVAEERIAAIRSRHARKFSFVRKLEDVGLA